MEADFEPSRNGRAGVRVNKFWAAAARRAHLSQSCSGGGLLGVPQHAHRCVILLGEEEGGPWDSHPHPPHFGSVCGLLPEANRAQLRAGLSGMAHGAQQSPPVRTSGYGGPAQKMGLDLLMI